MLMYLSDKGNKLFMLQILVPNCAHWLSLIGFSISWNIIHIIYRFNKSL